VSDVGGVVDVDSPAEEEPLFEQRSEASVEVEAVAVERDLAGWAEMKVVAASAVVVIADLVEVAEGVQQRCYVQPEHRE
jgi:DNA transposition AAA+ family ATPase